MNWWEYDQLPSGEPYDWGGEAARGGKPWDNLDFHLDLGCGTIPKGRLGIDRFYAPGVALGFDLANLTYVPAPHDCTPEIEGIAKRGYELYAQSRNDHFGGETNLHRLPFPDNSIESIISHHFFEHLRGEHAIRLIDECHRVLKPKGVLRIIVPAFPSLTAIADLDHKSYWMPETFEPFFGSPDGRSWLESFSVPYTSSRFEKLEIDVTEMTPAEGRWFHDDRRELRAALRKW